MQMSIGKELKSALGLDAASRVGYMVHVSPIQACHALGNKIVPQLSCLQNCREDECTKLVAASDMHIC